MLEIRPAAVILATATALRAGIVEETHTDIIPNGMRTIEPHCIRSLNLDDTITPPARDAQYMTRDFRKSSRLDRHARPSHSARIIQDRIPMHVR